MLSYDEFRTGLTYRQVYHLIWTRRWKRRRGVLGAWRQIKLDMYAEYCRRFEEERRRRRGGAAA
jgi:hypothetical protein